MLIEEELALLRKNLLQDRKSQGIVVFLNDDLYQPRLCDYNRDGTPDAFRIDDLHVVPPMTFHIKEKPTQRQIELFKAVTKDFYQKNK